MTKHAEKKVVKQISYERVLIAIAVIFCAIIIGYNAFFMPNVTEPTIIYIDKNSDNVNSQVADNNDASEEEYEPQKVINNNQTVADNNSNKEQINSTLGPININTASAKELVSGDLPGIGEVIATRIVEYREANGNFKSIDEIMNVKGIGEKIFEKIKDNICI